MGRTILIIAVTAAILLAVYLVFALGVDSGGDAGASESQIPTCGEDGFPAPQDLGNVDPEQVAVCSGGVGQECDAAAMDIAAYPNVPEEKRAMVEECLGISSP